MQYESVSPAKLNLRLKICGRRSDGYHLLSMWNAPLELSDKIFLSIDESSSSIRVEVNGPYADGVPVDSQNLIVKVTSAFFKKISIDAGLHMQLEKNIPIGGGLGGGSSNAATVLQILNTHFGAISENMLLKEEELVDLSLPFGADIPYFLNPSFARLSGIGEKIAPCGAKNFAVYASSSLIPCYLVFGLPPAMTKDIYGAFDQLSKEDKLSKESMKKILSDPLAWPPQDYDELLQGLSNDLEPAARASCSVLGEVLDRLRVSFGQRAQMTGSGSVLYLLPQTLKGGFLESEQEYLSKVALDFKLQIVKSAVSLA